MGRLLVVLLAAAALPARASHHGNAFIVNHNGYGEDCEVVDNCVQSSGWDGMNDDIYESRSNHHSDHYCSISATRSGYLSVEAFELEDYSGCGRGHFAVGSTQYCGTYYHTSQTTDKVIPEDGEELNGRHVTPDTLIEFDAYYWVGSHNDGFKICLEPDDSPTPRPSSTFAPTVSVPSLVSTTSGGCVSYGNCFMSTNYETDHYYGNDEDCTFQLMSNVPSGSHLIVESFYLEDPSGDFCAFDYLALDGVTGARYCGVSGPQGLAVAAGDTLTFHSDHAETRPGFRVCIEGAPSPAPTTTTPLPTLSAAPTTPGPTSMATAFTLEVNLFNSGSTGTCYVQGDCFYSHATVGSTDYQGYLACQFRPTREGILRIVQWDVEPDNWGGGCDWDYLATDCTWPGSFANSYSDPFYGCNGDEMWCGDLDTSDMSVQLADADNGAALHGFAVDTQTLLSFRSDGYVAGTGFEICLDEPPSPAPTIAPTFTLQPSQPSPEPTSSMAPISTPTPTAYDGPMWEQTGGCIDYTSVDDGDRWCIYSPGYPGDRYGNSITGCTYRPKTDGILQVYRFNIESTYSGTSCPCAAPARAVRDSLMESQA